MAVLAHVLSAQLSLLKALVNSHCGLAYADVEPPQPGCVCEPKLLRGRISQWEEQGVFLRTRNTIG